MPKSAVFGYMTASDEFNEMKEEICYINGNDGYANFISVPSFHRFKTDDAVKYMCIDESSNVPTICIYDLREMKKIKTVQYEPYRDKSMYATKISFSNSNNAFEVDLSADTIFFTTLEIPIDNASDYRVVDSYTEEDFQSGKPFPEF
jgi:hypothetical protein